MSYVINTLPDYVEQNNFPLLRKTVFGAKSASLFEIQTGVKSESSLNLFENDVVFQEDSCSRTAAGNATFTQRNIKVAKVAVHQDFCPKDLEAKYTQTQIKAGSVQDEMPFEQTFSEETAAKIAKNLEKAIWQGDEESSDPNLDKFDGIIVHLTESGVAVDGNTAEEENVTAATIEDIVDAVYAAIPADILEAGDIGVYMGTDNYRLYTKALKDSNLFHYSADSTDFEIVIPGTNVTIYGLNGLNGTDTIVAGRRSNFYIGVDLEDEEEDFEMWYSKDDRKVKFTTAFKYGTQVAFPDQVVLWQPFTS